MKKQPNILLMISDQQRPDTLGCRGKTPCRTPNVDRLAHEGISYDNALCTAPLCLPSRASVFTGKYPHQLKQPGIMTNSGRLCEPPVLTDLLRSTGYHTAYAGKAHLEAPGRPKAFRERVKESGLDQGRVQVGQSETKGKRVVDRWFDVAEGQGSYDYSVWCEENGLQDGWPVSDPEMRTHRKPSKSIPKPKRQELDPEHTYDAWVTDIALRFLRERPEDRPFFLVTGWFGPHPPFLIPEPYFSMYDPEDAVRPPNFGPQPDKPRSTRTSFYHQLFRDHGESWEAWKKSMAVYWGYCTLIDDQVGRLLTSLEHEGILDETLVIYISDHGEQLGSHGLWHKMMPYEESVRVPMIMRLPGIISADVRSRATVSLVDIAPTILSAVGEEAPADMQGTDLSPSFEDGREFQEEPYRFSEHKPLGEWHQVVEWRMVTDNHLKYVWNQGDMDELYNLEADPYELSNLVHESSYRDELERLRDLLFDWMIQTRDPLLRPF